MNIAWDDSEKTATIYLQNSGDVLLHLEKVGVFINGTGTSVAVSDGSTGWEPGKVVAFTIDETTDTLSYTGQNDVRMTITVSSTALGYAGAYTVTEEVRLVGS